MLFNNHYFSYQESTTKLRIFITLLVTLLLPALCATAPKADDALADKEAVRSQKERPEKVRADVAKYRTIVAASADLKQQAWDALVNSYPEARFVPVGDVGKLLKTLGIAGNEDPITGMEFVSVPKGCGTIGGVQVCFDAFNIGKYEVTQGQWKMVMGNNPSYFDSCGDNCPVEQVSWDDVQQFIQRLNQQSGANYRLPTDAEWEYVCRAGETDDYCGSNQINAVAWYEGNSGNKTHPVGQKQANTWGIHDMSGNVWEWVQDRYGQNYPSGTRNPVGPSFGWYRVNRGGGLANESVRVRASSRRSSVPSYRIGHLGFRLVAPVQ